MEPWLTLLLAAISGGIFGQLTPLIIGLFNRKKTRAETEEVKARAKKAEAEAEKTEVETQTEFQKLVRELVLELANLRKDHALEKEQDKERRDREFISEEKKRDAQRKQYELLQERLQTFESKYIQVSIQLDTANSNSRSNLIKLSELELLREKDQQMIKELQDEQLRLSKKTGQLEIKVNNK